jgi:hypothetical protein
MTHMQVHPAALPRMSHCRNKHDRQQLTTPHRTQT